MSRALLALAALVLAGCDEGQLATFDTCPRVVIVTYQPMTKFGKLYQYRMTETLCVFEMREARAP